jgi:gas vesicle protein
MTSGRRTSTYVGVALLGGLVGAAMGLLLAPAPGFDIRRRAVSRSIEEQEMLLRQAEMGMDMLADVLTEVLDLPASA